MLPRSTGPLHRANPQLVPRAWVNWAGSSGTIAASHNVVSVVNGGTGISTITWTPGVMVDADYALTGLVMATTTADNYIFVIGTPTASAAVVHSRGASNALADSDLCSVVAWGVA